MSRRGRPTWLWRVEGRGLDKPSWLFGTVHLADRRVLKFPAPVRRALDQCDKYCPEAPPSDFSSPEAVALYMLPPGKPSPLPASVIHRATAMLPATVPAARLKPWALALTIVAAAAARAAAARTMDGRTGRSGRRLGSRHVLMDAFLADLMQKEGKLDRPVETALEQVRIFDGLAMADQKIMLRDVLVGGQPATRAGQVVEDYVAVRTRRMRAALAKQVAAGGACARMMARTFGRRDKVMAARITTLLNERPGTSFFFALGAGHLVGRDGVVDRLRDEFDVRQVRA